MHEFYDTWQYVKKNSIMTCDILLNSIINYGLLFCQQNYCFDCCSSRVQIPCWSTSACQQFSNICMCFVFKGSLKSTNVNNWNASVIIHIIHQDQLSQNKTYHTNTHSVKCMRMCAATSGSALVTADRSGTKWVDHGSKTWTLQSKKCRQFKYNWVNYLFVVWFIFLSFAHKSYISKCQ